MNRRIVVVLGAAAVLLNVATVALATRNDMLSDRLAGGSLMLAFTAYLVVGLLLISRRPDNRIGWLLAGTGLLTVIGVLAEEYATYALVTSPGAPGGVAAAWFNGWWWLVTIGGIFIFIPLLFPTGRPINARWRRVAWAAALLLGVACVLSAFSPVLAGQDGRYVVDNHIGTSWGNAENGPFSWIIGVLAIAAILAAVASVAVRFRRARGVERQQLKWFFYAITLTVALGLAGDAGLISAPLYASEFLTALQFALMPAAIAVAILRFRLYEIDRIISRTLTYVVVSALLVALYLAVVTGLTAVTATRAGDSPIAVAAATLLAAAAFQPARRRIQAVVDRRFNRARYDAVLTINTYRSTLRHELDLEAIAAGLQAAADLTVQPARTMVWLRPGARS